MFRLKYWSYDPISIKRPSVITLMKESSTWNGFMRLFERALPKYGHTLEMPFDCGDEE